MKTTSGSGWGGVTYEISTNGTIRYSGTLMDGSSGVDYVCLEDGLHELKIADTDEDISWEFDDTAGASLSGSSSRVGP